MFESEKTVVLANWRVHIFLGKIIGNKVNFSLTINAFPYSFRFLTVVSMIVFLFF